MGKTFLCRSLDSVEYFDCELPGIRRMLADPEAFLKKLNGKRIVLDEIHRLDSPAEILKIAADHYPATKIIATGSSTIGVSSRFRDSLTGRKTELWLTPLTNSDMKAFGKKDLNNRFLYGGLPPFLMTEKYNESDYVEWIESYWSRDVLELFRLERRHSFLKFFELIITQSGSIFDATRFARPCEVSRPTISNYLSVLEATLIAHVIRPFSTRKSTEIISAPKVYAFDTGFVCFMRGWQDFRDKDRGFLWEHFVLNELHFMYQRKHVGYWRNKHGMEVDFILTSRTAPPTALECKWSVDSFDSRNLLSFRRIHPEGLNVVIAHDVDISFTRNYGNTEVIFTGISNLEEVLAGLSH